MVRGHDEPAPRRNVLDPDDMKPIQLLDDRVRDEKGKAIEPRRPGKRIHASHIRSAASAWAVSRPRSLKCLQIGLDSSRLGSPSLDGGVEGVER